MINYDVIINTKFNGCQKVSGSTVYTIYRKPFGRFNKSKVLARTVIKSGLERDLLSSKEKMEHCQMDEITFPTAQFERFPYL